MEAPAVAPQRPYHRRNASSKSNILRALVSPKSRADEQQSNQHSRTQTVPLLPPDHPHAAAKSRVLGERQGNVQSPPLSPSKSRPKAMVVSKTSHDLRTQAPMSSPRGAPASPKKSKSSTNLSNVFAKMNRSSKDLSAPVHKDKENTTPPSSSSGPLETPIWAQYASTTEVKPRSRPSTRDSNKSVKNIRDEIERYTPQEYSPSKQRNFNGDLSQPQLRPTLGSRPRPQSEYVLGTDLMGAIGRRLSGDRTSLVGRRSDDLDRRTSKDVTRRVSGDKTWLSRKDTERKASGSSMEQAPMKEKLTIAKRGGRVMAAVAAFQGKNKDQAVKDKAEAALDPKAVDQAFEAVLDSRNVPEPMRQKMRSLTLRVKADFIKQDQEASKTATNSPVEAVGGNAMKADSATAKAKATSPTEQKQIDDDSKATKRSRARSRTFTFSKGDKRGDASSPSKKQRSQSKSRATSAYDAKDTSLRTPTSPTTPRPSMDRRAAGPASPAEYIAYLRKHQDPVQVEVGRIHKLRILLRNETVAWVDSFLSLGGMTEIVGLLHRIMDLEWREEHEDQLLHDALLCLKGLCTTGRAMEELEKVADHLFPALIAMLFTDSKDEVKRGPAEYSTRAIITNVLFNFLASATSSSPAALEARAQRVLKYLGEPAKPEEARPVDFVLDMRTPRPYKLWCREVSNVTKEVFWIFLHHLNVVPSPKSKTGNGEDSESVTDAEERAKVLEATYTHRHFPGTRPPVPAAPYIGGVEWDATTYVTSHLDLLNGLLASLPTSTARNALRAELRESGFEKVLGSTLRTCKEKFYSGVHDALRAWVAAASEDGWETGFVREGPTLEEQARGYSPKKSPNKKVEKAPRIEDVPKLDLDIGVSAGMGGKLKNGFDGDTNDDDDGWLG